MRLPVFPLVWCLALGLGNWLGRERLAAQPENRDLIAQLFGESRTVVSSRLVQTGDRYFHSGLSKENCELFGAAGHDHHHDHDDQDCHNECDHGMPESEEPAASAKTYRGPRWWRFLMAEIRPSSHMHLETQRENAEVLPWFWAAVKLDPHNVQAYEIGAFWLANQIRTVDKAVTFLDEGIARNPEAFELELTKAEIIFKTSPETACAVLDKAAGKWRAARALAERGELPAHLKNPETLDMGEILLLQGDCHRRLGRTAEAIDCFRRAMPYSNRPEVLEQRVQELQ